MQIAWIAALLIVAQPPAGWSLHTPKGGGFQIAMPARPAEKSVTQKGPTGPVEILDVSCQANECLYRAERTTMARPFGKENERGALDAMVKAVAAKATVKAEQSIDVQGHPGRDLMIEAPLKPGAKPSTIAIRLVVADRDVYQIRVFALTPGTSPSRAGEFFDSFKIQPPARP